ncbi:MAG: ATP-dependent protease LonB [Nanoarchaeota archaeon]
MGAGKPVPAGGKVKTTKDISVSIKIIDQVIGQDQAVDMIKTAAQQRRHVLLIGEPGTGKCVGKDTLIQLSDGSVKTAAGLYEEIRNHQSCFVPGVNPDLSLGHARLLNAEKTSGEAVTIKTNTGKTITVSNEHSFLTFCKEGAKWVHADALGVGDFLAAVRRSEASCELQDLSHLSLCYTPSKVHSNVKKIKVPSHMNAEFAEFCGLLWSEGYIARHRSITFTNSEKMLIERFSFLAQSLFGLQTTVRHFPDKNAYVSTIESSTLAFNLKLLGWGVHVPDEIMKSQSGVIRSFLRAYFDGDGSATKRGFEVTTKNAYVASQIQALLLRFDITCILKKGLKRATNRTMLPKEYTTIIIYDAENLSRFRSIGFSIPAKSARLELLCNKEPHSNIDKMPHVGELLFDLKERLHLTSEDVGIEIHQWQRYLKGTRTPSRLTVEKALRSFAQRFVGLKHLVPLMQVDGTIDVSGILYGIGFSKERIARKLGVPVPEVEGHPGLTQLALDVVNDVVTEETEAKLVGLYQLVNSDVVWERITRIDNAGVVELYDFEAEHTHNFIANNLVVHNSMLGLALAELLPREKLVDVLSFSNPNDENQPLIRTVPAGKGREIVMKAKVESASMFKNQNLIFIIIVLLSTLIPYYLWKTKAFSGEETANAIIYAASMITGIFFIVGFLIFLNLGKRMAPKGQVPKVIVDNFDKKHVPFYDATGAHAGALLGDVLHDPFQSGGLGTPSHERVIAGMIHKAHMGVLFVDEIATLEPATQQELLTSLQEGKYAITGQSERSAGAMVRTEAVPCNFIMIAAGNIETVRHMHPALRSRIRGYGYEVYMENTFPDSEENRMKIARFVAQEVVKDKKIPHFSWDAVEVIIQEARKRANRKGHLSLRLRELGGLIRAAGDIALEKKSDLVRKEHVFSARRSARTLEQQIADKFIERKKEYEVIVTSGKKVGRVNGLAVLGGEGNYSGIILPIESEVTPGGKENQIIATGKLGEIAQEAIKNVSAIVKKYFGLDIKGKFDIYVQFLQTYEGVEGDSASIAVATSIISALKDVPVRQEYAMTGSLSVRGEVLPVGGVSAKVDAAIDAGMKKVIVPKANLQDIVVDKERLAKIEIIPVTTIAEVLKEALDWKGKEAVLKLILKK